MVAGHSHPRAADPVPAAWLHLIMGARHRDKKRSARRRDRIRYAVVGLGHIAQNAVLPAFANAARNSELVALISHDSTKLRAFGRQYKIPQLYSYPEFEVCLERAEVDAVYI